MIFLLGIFTWIALRKAYYNDQAILAGGIPYEKTESDEKLFTWPDLVYTEMLCMIAPDDRHDRLVDRPARAARRSGQPDDVSRIPPKRRGTSSACRRCWSTSIPGWPAWSCRR